MSIPCTLCNSQESTVFVEVSAQTPAYYRCAQCDLIYLNPAEHLSFSEEKQRYETHKNIPGDAGYEKFLRRLADPLLPLLTPGSKGLDFGCGPGPALAALLRAQGFEMNIYDPYFAPDKKPLEQKYDFVTCTEVVEHFNFPKKSFELLMGLVKPGGLLGVMTQTPPGDPGVFLNWHYRRDPTHLNFYSSDCVDWIVKRWKFTRLLSPANIWILRKD